MSANEVLLWMSARQQGSWQQYRAAFEQLFVDDGASEGDLSVSGGRGNFAAHHELRFNLSRLGHVEFTAGQHVLTWRVAPPVLAVSTLPDDTWLGIAAGARSLPLLNEIMNSGLSLGPEPHAVCPDVHLLRSPDVSRLVALADRIGMFVQRDAPAAILASIKPLDFVASSTQTTVPAGDLWTFERFCETECRWLRSTRAEAIGAAGSLFQARAPHAKQSFICRRGDVRAVSPAVGKYVVLRRARRHVLRYDAKNRRLSVLAGCRPPELIERALVLCSGRPPDYESVEGRGVVHYLNVTASIAATVGSLLHQEIRT
jgi:hypothetical protein